MGTTKGQHGSVPMRYCPAENLSLPGWVEKALQIHVNKEFPDALSVSVYILYHNLSHFCYIVPCYQDRMVIYLHVFNKSFHRWTPPDSDLESFISPLLSTGVAFSITPELLEKVYNILAVNRELLAACDVDWHSQISIRLTHGGGKEGVPVLWYLYNDWALEMIRDGKGGISDFLEFSIDKENSVFVQVLFYYSLPGTDFAPTIQRSAILCPLPHDIVKDIIQYRESLLSSINT